MGTLPSWTPREVPKADPQLRDMCRVWHSCCPPESLDTSDGGKGRRANGPPRDPPYGAAPTLWHEAFRFRLSVRDSQTWTTCSSVAPKRPTIPRQTASPHRAYRAGDKTTKTRRTRHGTPEHHASTLRRCGESWGNDLPNLCQCWGPTMNHSFMRAAFNHCRNSNPPSFSVE